MKMRLLIAFSAFSAGGILILSPTNAGATEEPSFLVEKRYADFEIRKYGPMLIAQTENEEDFENAGNKAFRVLADYIFGGNTAKAKIQMTAPVVQQGEKIAMTAPVKMSRDGNRFRVQFVMPSNYTRETLPQPTDPRVQITQVPARRIAVYAYSGSWSEELFNRNLAQFKEILKRENLQARGEPIFARFNSPFSLWFLRRNEIWIEITP